MIRFILLFIGMLGCVDDLDPPSRIDRNRVLGARVEVVGNEERASPLSNEEVVVRWLVVDPAGVEPLAWAFRACFAAEVRIGAPPCEGTPFAATEVLAPAIAEPRFQFRLPVTPTGNSIDVLVEGVICANGAPTLPADAEAARCEGEQAQGNLVRVTFIVNAEEGNRHPAFAGWSLSVGAEPWEEATPGPLEPCAATLLPQVAWQPEILISATIPADNREPTQNDEVESFELGHFVTAGVLNRPRTLLGQTDLQTTLTWEPPEPVGPAQQTQRVRAFFVLRDGRGGTAWMERSLCLLGGSGP